MPLGARLASNADSDPSHECHFLDVAVGATRSCSAPRAAVPILYRCHLLLAYVNATVAPSEVSSRIFVPWPREDQTCKEPPST